MAISSISSTTTAPFFPTPQLNNATTASTDKTDAETTPTQPLSQAEPIAPEQKAQAAEQQIIDELSARDREVRTHEAAHLGAAGIYANGGPTFSFQRGPDGKQYAVGGEVSIDTSPIPGDPEATIRKAQTIRRAALAPADPSGQDRSVAASATQLELAAKTEQIQTSADEDDESEESKTSAPAENSESTDEETQDQTTTTSISNQNAIARFERNQTEAPSLLLDELA